MRLTKELLAAKPLRVVAVSVSGRGGAAVFVGRDGTVDRPTVVGPAPCRGTRLRLPNGARAACTCRTTRAALLAKKQWFTANEPLRARQLRHVLVREGLSDLPPDRAAQSPTARSGPDAPQWDARALEHTGCDEPGAARRAAVGGRRVRSTHAQRTALGSSESAFRWSSARTTASARTSAPARDYPGAYAITLGTHAVVRAIRRDIPDGSFRFYDLPPDRHVIGGNAVMGGRAADWFLDLIFGANDRARARHFVAMDTAAARCSGGLRRRALSAVSVRPGRAGIATGRKRSVHRTAHVARSVERVSRRARRRRVRDPFDFRSDPRVVRRADGDPPDRQRRSQPHLVRDSREHDRPHARSVRRSCRGARRGRVRGGCARHVSGLRRRGAALVPIKQRYEPDAALTAEYETLYRDWQTVSDATRPLDRRTPANFAL